MIADGLRRAGIAASYCPLTLIALLAGALFGLSGTQWWTETDVNWVILPVLAALAASFVIFYQQSRRAGEPLDGEHGSFWAWLGWMLLGVLPVLAIMLGHMAVTGFDHWFDEVEGSWIESLVFGLGIIIGTPMMVVSGGRAINRSGPAALTVLAATLGHTKSILIAVLALVALPEFLTSVLSLVIRSEALSFPADLGIAAVEGIFFFALSILTAGVYASIYRSIEGECAPQLVSQ